MSTRRPSSATSPFTVTRPCGDQLLGGPATGDPHPGEHLLQSLAFVRVGSPRRVLALLMVITARSAAGRRRPHHARRRAAQARRRRPGPAGVARSRGRRGPRARAPASERRGLADCRRRGPPIPAAPACGARPSPGRRAGCRSGAATCGPGSTDPRSVLGTGRDRSARRDRRRWWSMHRPGPPSARAGAGPRPAAVPVSVPVGRAPSSRKGSRRGATSSLGRTTGGASGAGSTRSTTGGSPALGEHRTRRCRRSGSTDVGPGSGRARLVGHEVGDPVHDLVERCVGVDAARRRPRPRRTGRPRRRRPRHRRRGPRPRALRSARRPRVRWSSSSAISAASGAARRLRRPA